LPQSEAKAFMEDKINSINKKPKSKAS